MAITHYTSSDGRQTAIVDMAFTHINNALRKLEREGDGDTDLADALRAELARRQASEDHLKPPADSADKPMLGHNKPPEPTPNEAREEFKRQLEASADAVRLLDRQADLEMRTAKLPTADAVKSDEDLEPIDRWLRDAAQLERDVSAFHERIKAPYLMRGQIIDGFKRTFLQDLTARADGVEKRKKAYLIAKARAEEARRQARAAAEAAAAAEQRRLEAEAAAKAEAARLEAEAAQRKLDEAAAEAAAREASEAAQAEADGTLPGTVDTEDLEAAQAELQAAQFEADRLTEQAAAHAQAADHAEQIAEDLESATHALPKTGASSLKKVWKHKVTGPAALLKSLGPLGAYIPDREVEAALVRASKADPLPTIPGVEFEEDFDVKTDTRRRVGD